MKQLLKHIYYTLFPQWEVIHVIVGEYVDDSDEVYNRVRYEVCLSKRLNKCKLESYGEKAKMHPRYVVAVTLVYNLNQALIDGKDIADTINKTTKILDSK